MKRKRVLIGSISQESNSFNPIKTTLSDFIVKRGSEILAEENRVLNGFINVAEAKNIELLPGISAMARPGGRTVHAVYQGFKEEILKIAGSVELDAIALELHGAMQTDELDDPEGDLLESLRRVVGDEIPIAVGLDLHGHITSRMLANADYCTGYKKNPHSDNIETGERTMNMLLSLLNREIAPCTAMGKIPMITRGKDETTAGAIRDLWEVAKKLQLEHGEILDISIFNVQHFLDATELGQTVLVVTNSAPDIAGVVCNELCRKLWEIRDEVVADFPSIAETMTYIANNPKQKPFAVGDIGDRVVAGTPGDSTATLKYLLDNSLTLKAAIPITDPDAVQKAEKAGIGVEIKLEVGGKYTPSFQPVSVTGTVVCLTANETETRNWGVDSLGRTAVLKVGNIHLLLMTKSGISMFPECFTSQGIEIDELDLIVVKSGYHFKIYFSNIATPLMMDSPGLSVFRPEEFPFQKGRPIYPLDQIDYEPGAPLMFNAGYGRK
jgi:microcystin degradation protein MlrC